MSTNLWLPFQVQLSADGSGELEVGAPALGYNWQAFSTLGQAPSGLVQLILVSGQVVASGGRQSGAFAAGSGQGVTVSVSGGPPSSSVSGVLQGSVGQGSATRATLPGGGTLIEVYAEPVLPLYSVQPANGAWVLLKAAPASPTQIHIASIIIANSGSAGGQVGFGNGITSPPSILAALYIPPTDTRGVDLKSVPLGVGNNLYVVCLVPANITVLYSSY